MMVVAPPATKNNTRNEETQVILINLDATITTMPRLQWAEVYAALAVGVLATQWLVSSIVNEAYMDEPFHAPQATLYCQAGLYLVSCVLLSATSRLFGGPNVALHTLSALRATNSVLSLVLFAVLYHLIKNISRVHVRNVPRGIILWNSVNAFLFPVSFFYYFLYYTDTLSTLFVLLCYLLARKQWYCLSALIGLLSVTIRQTNIVWMCFSAGAVLVQQIQKSEARKLLAKEKTLTGWMTGRCQSFTLYECVLDHSRFLAIVKKNYVVKVVRTLFPFSLALAVFTVFIKWNEGIALGDKQNHTFSIHIPQLYYYALFLGVLGSPILVSFNSFGAFMVFIIRKLHSLKGLATMATLFSLNALSIYYFTYEHPFILSDNRHYSFYVWKNIYRRFGLARYALVPVYFACAWFAHRKLGRYQSSIFITLYGGAVALTIIPSPLLEFRYYIVPYLIYRVHVPVEKTWKLAIELILYLALNAAALFIFLYRPFVWPQEPGVQQRFMW